MPASRSAAGQLRPKIQQLPQHLRLLQRLLDEAIQGLPLDPLHLDGREPLAVDLDAPLQVDERHGEGQPGRLQARGNVPIALLPGAHFAGEAFQRPTLARGRTVDAVDAGEVARPEHRQFAVVRRRLAPAEFLVAHRVAEVLGSPRRNRSASAKPWYHLLQSGWPASVTSSLRRRRAVRSPSIQAAKRLGLLWRGPAAIPVRPKDCRPFPAPPGTIVPRHRSWPRADRRAARDRRARPAAACGPRPPPCASRQLRALPNWSRASSGKARSKAPRGCETGRCRPRPGPASDRSPHRRAPFPARPGCRADVHQHDAQEGGKAPC